MPFGEEINAGTGGRTAQQGYVVDNVTQKFTQKERDVETGLDYFGARYYSSAQGRFTSVDPLLASGRVAMPQSWNRYSYVLNNPLRLVDPTGMGDDDPPDQKIDPADVVRIQANLSQVGVYHDPSISVAAAATSVVVSTLNGAASALSEDNGLGPMDAPQNSVGRAIGHILALGQSFGETVIGTGMMGAGGALAVGSDGVLAVPAAEVSATGAAITVHGVFVGANTWHNIFSSNTSDDRSGKNFTKQGKQQVIDENRANNGGTTTCESCGVETTPAQKSQRGVSPPRNETQVDHIVPKSRGGQGRPENGQVLCRGCNRTKSNRMPE